MIHVKFWNYSKLQILILSIICVSFLLISGFKKSDRSDYIWFYSTPDTYFNSKQEQRIAAFISRDQLEQLSDTGLVSQSSLNKNWYFLKNKPNALYLTSYLVKFDESYFLFVYAIDIISGRIVYGDYHNSKTIEGFKGITYWPMSKIEKYNIEDHQDMYSPKMKNVSMRTTLLNNLNRDIKSSLYVLMNISTCRLSKEKGLNIKTDKSIIDIVNIQDLLSDGRDIVKVKTPDKYMHRLMTANFIYKIIPEKISTSEVIIELLEMIEVQSLGGFTADRKESKTEIGKLGAESGIKHIDEAASKICKIIKEKTNQYKPLPETESVTADPVTGEILKIKYIEGERLKEKRKKGVGYQN